MFQGFVKKQKEYKENNHMSISFVKIHTKFTLVVLWLVVIVLVISVTIKITFYMKLIISTPQLIYTKAKPGENFYISIVF